MVVVIPSRNFDKGTIDTIEARSIARGAASRSLNWLTMGDRIELRRGHDYLGTENTGGGKVSGIKKAVSAAGVDVLFGTYGKKLKYYDRDTLDWIENGTNLLGDNVVDANGVAKEPISFAEYTGLAGNQLWLTSVNCAGLFKVMTANPGSAVDQYDSSKNFKGLIKIDTNRMLLWGRKEDRTGLYGSYIDTQTYTTVSSEEFGEGDGTETDFTRYLSFKAKAKQTLTSTGTNPSDGDQVLIGSTTYTFRTSPSLAFEVDIGANAEATLLNLKKAINRWGTPGTEYAAATTAHPDAEATTATSTTLVVQAKVPGTAGNSIATTVPVGSTHSWGATTMTGGAASKRTCFGVSITAGAVVLTDDYDGNLSASDGSTGTVNYATGQVSIEFATAPTDGTAITSAYQWEDSTANGIADFTKSSPRTAGQGFIFRQDEGGGALQSIGQYDQIYYCLHVKKTWVLNITADDTNATNLPYRELVGIPHPRAQVETGRGIFYVDTANPKDKKLRLLTYAVDGSAKVIPVAISDRLDLNSYDFDEGAAFEFGDFVLFACATLGSTTTIDGVEVPANNRIICYNQKWDALDILDYAVSCFDSYDGALVAGSSISNNFFELFSGFSDPNDTDIPNFWEGSMDDLDKEGLAKVKGLHMEGDIGPNAKIKVSISVDNGPFIEVGGSDDPDTNEHTYAIEGSGTYVDRTERSVIGANTLGRKEIGGGGDGAEAYHYEKIVPLRLDKGETFKVRFEAFGVGYVSVSRKDWYDVRFKGDKAPRKYRT